jgi:hypothetical protein
VDGDFLYLHKEDFDNSIAENSLPIERTREMLRDREKIYNNYVQIVGVFHMEERPALYPQNGRIFSIQKCEFWSQPSHPFSERVKELQRQPK